MEKTFMTNQLMTQLSNTTKSEKGQVDDYTTVCLLDFTYFEKNSRLIAIQEIIFTGKIKAPEQNTRVVIYYILGQSK